MKTPSCKFGRLFPQNTRPWDKSCFSRGKKKTQQPKPKHTHTHTPTLKKGVLENEFHCRHSLVWRLVFFCVFTVGRMHCPPGAQVSWVLRNKLSVLRTQWTKSRATPHGRTSVRNTEHEIRQWYLAPKYLQALMQILLGGIWEACLTCMCKHMQGLPRKW